MVCAMWEGEVVSGCGRVSGMWEAEWYVRGICTVISINGMSGPAPPVRLVRFQPDHFFLQAL